MLMVTTTVRMVDRVHGNTTSLGPGVSLHSELVLRARCLCEYFVSNHCESRISSEPHTEHWLVCSSTSCNDTDHASG